MKVLKRFFILIFAIFSTLSAPLFCSCNNYDALSFTAFNTDVSVYVKGHVNGEVEKELENLLTDIENSLSVSKKTSCVYKLNEEKANVEVALDDHAYYLAVKAKEYYRFTEGKFNPAILPLSKLYKLSSGTFDSNVKNYTPPTKEEILPLLQDCDFDLISVDEQNKTAKKLSEKIQIDFGGLAKGYAVDKIKEALIIEGFTKGFINVGGSSIYVFEFKDGLSIRHPRKNGESIIKVDGKLIKNAEVSTSGDYVKYYTDKNGNRYCHIIDGSTGNTANTGIISVTVIADDSANSEYKSACFVDALSTAMMLMDKDGIKEFITDLPQGLKVFAVTEEEKHIITNVEKDCFDLLDADYQIVNI